MAECDWAVLCDYAFPDIGKKMCLIGIFDRINATSVPTALHQSALALKITGDPQETISLKILILRPTGGHLGEIAIEATLGEAGTAELQLGMAGLPLPDEGAYEFRVSDRDRLLKQIGVTVVVVRRTEA